MSDFSKLLVAQTLQDPTDFSQFVEKIGELSSEVGYDLVEVNSDKPWGAYMRINSNQADRFVEEFFPGLSAKEARLGVNDAELSPKFLIVKPGERLSWQYHHRRAERWRFLTPGAYRKSTSDDEGDRIEAAADEVIQFQTGERHRLEGVPTGIVLVAEIWQHSDIDQPSDESDIVRLSDDYQR